MAKGMRVQLTDQDVRDIFFQRASGKTQKHIADNFGCSDSHISSILTRRKHGDVHIDEDTLKKVRELAAPPRRSPRRSAANIPLHQALAEYSTACHNVNEARKRCIAAGAGSDELEVMREIINAKDNGASK